jgi:hypothetical protein
MPITQADQEIEDTNRLLISDQSAYLHTCVTMQTYIMDKVLSKAAIKKLKAHYLHIQ